MPTENSLLRILHYISLFIVIKLAMWYSACMKSACSHHPLLSFRSPPVSSKALPQKFFLRIPQNCLWDAAVLSAYVCITSALHQHVLSVQQPPPPHTHTLCTGSDWKKGSMDPPSLILRRGGEGGRRAPGRHCLRMRQIAMEFHGSCAHTCTYVCKLMMS